MSETPTKSPAAFRTIGEVAAELGVAQHVLRFWETRFPQVQPLKRGGNRRYYRPDDVAMLRDIHRMLHAEGYTIKGVQRRLEGKAGGHIAPILPVGGAGDVRNAGERPLPHAAPPPAAAAPDLATIRAVRDRLAAALTAARA